MTQLPKDSGAATPEETEQAEEVKRTANWNYVTFVAQGIIVDASKSIGSAHLLLPYLYVSTGSPVILAGMLMPLVAGSRLIGEYVSAPILNAVHTRKWFLFGGWMATAAALAAAGLGARIPEHWVVMVIFVCAALTMGIAKGLNALAFNDLMANLFTSARRNSGLFLMSALGGLVTIAVAWYMHRLSVGGNAVDHNINLALGAATVTVVAPLIMTLWREPKIKPGMATATSRGESSKPTFYTRIKKFRDVLEFPWFRRYLFMRCLTATVITAMPFYAVHGATHHAHKHAGGLSAYVIATSLAVIICGPLWQRIGKRSQRFTMALGASLVGVAGLWALAIGEITPLQTIIAQSFVFALAAAGIQGVNGSRMLYLIDAAPKDELAYFVAVSTTVSAILQLFVASIFGYIAQLQGVHWPVILLVVLNFMAAAYSLSLHEPSSKKTADKADNAQRVTGS